MLYNLQLISLYLVYHIYANLWNIIISFIVKHVCFVFFYCTDCTGDIKAFKHLSDR